MSKVTLNTIYTFDVDNGYNFTFSYKGAENVNGNVLRIYKIVDEDTNTPIITQIQNSTKLNSLSATTAKTYNMINGERYFATITMINNGVELTNTTSNPVYFYCFTTPTLSFKNTSMFDEPIRSSSFIVELEYSYDKTGSYHDELNEYKVIVYPYADDINQLQIYESKRAYATDLNNLTAYITDLEIGQKEAKSYYLKAVGTTKYGVSIESSLLRVDIQNDKQYIKTAFNAILQNQSAAIHLSSNLIVLDGEQSGDVSFDNGKVIIGEYGEVSFKKDISVKSVETSIFDENKGNNFLLALKFSNFPIDSDLLILANKNGTSKITLSAISNKIYSLTEDAKIDPNGNGFLTLITTDILGENIIRTNLFNLNYINDEFICYIELLVLIERVGGIYNLKFKIVE